VEAGAGEEEADEETILSYRTRMSFRLLFWLSLLIRLLAISSRWTILPFRPYTFAFVTFSEIMIVPWVVLFAVALRKHGKLALWLLVSLPLIAFWPYILYSLEWSCSHGNRNACI
jgi:hypothetical protein